MPLTDNAKGAVLMMTAMAGFTLNDTFMKALSDDLPLFQAIFLRGVGATTLLFAAAWATGALSHRVARGDAIRVAVRGIGEIGAAYFFILALFNLPLANVTAVLQALPLTLTLAGALFLREPVGWRRLTAILVGLAGVMLIIRPGPDGFSIYALSALASVACVTLRDLVTRGLTRAMPSLLVAAAVSAMVTVFGAVGTAASGDWAPVTWPVLVLLGGSVGFLIVGYSCSVGTMRIGDIAAVAPFRYTSLLWSLVLGLVVFGDWPDALTLAGAGIVAATGLYTLYREQRRRRA